jgi:hypothetical protein
VLIRIKELPVRISFYPVRVYGESSLVYCLQITVDRPERDPEIMGQFPACYASLPRFDDAQDLPLTGKLGPSHFNVSVEQT